MQKIWAWKEASLILQTLMLATPWARFLTPPKASTLSLKIAEHADRLHGTRKGKAVELPSRARTTIATIIKQSDEAPIILRNLALWVDVEVLDAVAQVVSRSNNTRVEAVSPDSVKIGEGDMTKLLAVPQDQAASLIEALIRAYPSSARAFASLLSGAGAQKIVVRSELLPSITAILELPSGVNLDGFAPALTTCAMTALADEAQSSPVRLAAIDVIAYLHDADKLNVTDLAIGVFGLWQARLLGRVARSPRAQSTSQFSSEISSPLVRQLVDEGLKRIVRVCADVVPLTPEQTELLRSFSEPRAHPII